MSSPHTVIELELSSFLCLSLVGWHPDGSCSIDSIGSSFYRRDVTLLAWFRARGRRMKILTFGLSDFRTFFGFGLAVGGYRFVALWLWKLRLMEHPHPHPHQCPTSTRPRPIIFIFSNFCLLYARTRRYSSLPSFLKAIFIIFCFSLYG